MNSPFRNDDSIYLDDPSNNYFTHHSTHENNTQPYDYTQDIADTNVTENYASNGIIGTPIGEKDDTVFRIYGQNTNGLNLGHDGGDFAEFCENMFQLEVDCWGIFETNLDTTQHHVGEKLYRTIQKHFDHSRLSFGSSNITSPKAPRYYKPGGTLLATQGKYTGRISKTGCDPMGRWSCHTFSCKNNKSLTVISAYQVCDQPLIDSSTDCIKSFTASSQQVSMLRQQDRFCSPREAFIIDL